MVSDVNLHPYNAEEVSDSKEELRISPLDGCYGKHTVRAVQVDSPIRLLTLG